MTLLRAVRNAITKPTLPDTPRPMLVAVSGGADSVALLLALHELSDALGLQLRVAHLHHGLRGVVAEADARFVRALARRLGVPCTIGRAAVARRARHNGVSVEMAARTARYAFLVKTAQRWQRERQSVGPVVIATAHTADDQAETVLMRLARGAGTRGLSGIPAAGQQDGVPVLRPMLQIRRRDVLVYLRGRKQLWREDASNCDPAMLRNRVRHDVLPHLARVLNPRISEALIRAADLLREEDTWMQQLTDAALPGVVAPRGKQGAPVLIVSRLALQPKAARRRLILGWLAAGGIEPEVIDLHVVDAVDRLAMSRRGTGRCGVAGRLDAVRRYDELGLAPQSKPVRAQRKIVLRVPGKTRVPACGVDVEVRAGHRIIRERGKHVGALPARASLSASRVGRRQLVLRTWQPGDRIRPLGLNGRVKLQDLFVNAKIPAEDRGRIPVLVCGREIVWIPGYRVAQGWEVGNPADAMLEVRVSRARSQP